MKLVYDKTNKEVKIGDITETFRGEKCKVISFTEPLKSSSTGRVYVEFDNNTRREFFPSVIGTKFVEEE